MAYVPLRVAIKTLGMSKDTLRKYADLGIIRSFRNPANQRLFDCDSFVTKQQPITICYCRVSSHKQQDDLNRQVSSLQSLYPEAEIIKDVGSGLNYKRKGLKTLLERLMSGHRITLVVTYKDRLTRFGFDLIKFLVEYNNGQILVLNEEVDTSREQELTKDLLAILHYFSARLYGTRSHKNKENKNIPNRETKEHFSQMVRSLKENL